MGRIMDLCGEIAAEAEEGPQGLVVPHEVFERLRAEWDEDDIDDAVGLVRDSLLQSELVEAADTLSARLVEALGAFGEENAFTKAEAAGAALTLETVAHIVRRVARLEEIIEIYREGAPPDRKGFDALRRRLMDLGIENEMQEEASAEELEEPEGAEDDDEG